MFGPNRIQLLLPSGTQFLGLQQGMVFKPTLFVRWHTLFHWDLETGDFQEKGLFFYIHS